VPEVLSALAKMPWQVVSVRLLSKLPDVSVTSTAAVATAHAAAHRDFFIPFAT
jgi:hypothetical protein